MGRGSSRNTHTHMAELFRMYRSVRLAYSTLCAQYCDYCVLTAHDTVLSPN